MSGLPFELLLALRYLRPKRTFVSIITLISILGVTLGVAVLIIVISVMSGFDRQMRDTILGFNAHLTISPQETGLLTNYPALSKVIESNRDVTAVAPLVSGQVLMETPHKGGDSSWSAPFVRGVDPEAEKKVSVVPSRIVDGKYDLSDRGMVMGFNLAEQIKVKVGDRVNVYSPAEIKKMKESMDKGQKEAVLADEYEVKGIFDVGYYDYDSAVVLISLENAQDMYNLNDSVHDLTVMLHDPMQADAVGSDLEKRLGPDYRVDTWLQQSTLLKAVEVEKNVMFMILFCIMIVAALCILSALITFVVQKTREIGMLKALGATDFQVAGLFLSQSAFVGLVGDLAGFGLGILALTYRNEFLHFMRRATGMELFPASIYGFTDLPALIVPGDIALICGSAFFICILGGVIPAWRAGRLKPVEALRYE